MNSDRSDTAQLVIEVPPSPSRSALDERCPKCAASPGEPCRTSSGDRAYYEHSDRRRMTRYVPLEDR